MRRTFAACWCCYLLPTLATYWSFTYTLSWQSDISFVTNCMLRPGAKMKVINYLNKYFYYRLWNVLGPFFFIHYTVIQFTAFLPTPSIFAWSKLISLSRDFKDFWFSSNMTRSGSIFPALLSSLSITRRTSSSYKYTTNFNVNIL